MKKLLLLLFATVLFGCSKDDDQEEMNCCVNYDVSVDVKYVNEEGENLLETEDPVRLSDIKVYHKIGSEWKGYFEGHHDIPNSVRIIELEGGKHLRVFLSQETDEKSISETRLVFPGDKEEILKAEILIDGGLTAVRKLWYKGELAWEFPVDDSARFITIVR